MSEQNIKVLCHGREKEQKGGRLTLLFLTPRANSEELPCVSGLARDCWHTP